MPDQARALVDELAQLAQLELADDEADALAGQLDRVLGYIERLRSVDVAGVPEYVQDEQARSGLRDDVPDVDVDADEVLAGVPVRRERLVAVPRFKSDGSEG